MLLKNRRQKEKDFDIEISRMLKDACEDIAVPNKDKLKEKIKERLSQEPDLSSISEKTDD